jgi:hypothetical protein
VRDYESELFALLNTDDSETLKRRQLQFMDHPSGASTTAQHWISVLLAWHMQGVGMDRVCAKRLVEALTPTHLSACEGTLYDVFLPRVANRLLDVDAFELADSAEFRNGRHESIARAIAFGVCRDEWLPPYLTCARDACRLLQKIDYVPATHALCCLRFLQARNRDHRLGNDVAAFLNDARGYLGWSAEVVGSARLKWELRVYDCSIER